MSRLIMDSAGNLYGTTHGGGAFGFGTVFKLDSSGNETILHSFDYPLNDGRYPAAGLIMDPTGNLYGTTAAGGAQDGGTVFKIDTSGNETLLHSFGPPVPGDGQSPLAGLITDSTGYLYGTTNAGGTFGRGTVFMIDTSGKETVIYSFGPLGSNDGLGPQAALITSGGYFYGTTLGGGSSNGGTVFKIDASGNEMLLHNFPTSSNDGASPLAELLMDGAGNLYGTTEYGGTFGNGTVFKIDTSGKETVLHSFLNNSPDGVQPVAGVIMDSAGNLYGTTSRGGSFGNGTVFKIDTSGKETVIYSFTGSASDGSGPQASLIMDRAGNLYGTTAFQGLGYGAVFKLSQPPSGLQFVPVQPCRVVDTRNSDGPFGGPELIANSTRNFAVGNSACGIPLTAMAYSVNVTVVPDSSLGYLTIWPYGSSQPLVSTLNSDGRIKANAAIVPAGYDPGGSVNVYVTDPTQFILDIDGYFVPSGSSGSPLAFYPLTPCRVADTRNPNGDLGGPYISGGTARSFPVGTACGMPASASAYSLNFTAVPHGSLSYITAWPQGGWMPLASLLNAPTGTVVANAAIIRAGALNGGVSVYASDDTDVVIDINGYFAPPGAGGLSFYPSTPCRVLDTRTDAGAFSGTMVVNVSGSPCAVNSSAQAYVFNATVVPSALLSYLTLWPDGQAQPFVSTLNAFDGAISSNMAIVPTANGMVDAYATTGTQLIFDISGYFAP